MNKFMAAAITLLLVSGLFAFRTVERRLDDVFALLGISQKQARDYVFMNFHHGTLSIPYSKAIRSVAIGDRAATVRELGNFMKKYTASAEYLALYSQERDNARPKAPESSKEYIARRIVEAKQDIAATEEEMKKASADMKKLYEATLKMQKDELKILQNPNDPMFAMYGGKTEEMEQQEQSEYRKNLKDFESNYPADPKLQVKKRLKEFLELTADIDFSAKLVDKYGKKRFADPELESKSSYWKMCFRAGSETIGEARKFAQQWLTELN